MPDTYADAFGPPTPVATPRPQPRQRDIYADAFDSGAEDNLVASTGVTPQAAAQAHNNQRVTGVPAELGMHISGTVNDMARSRRDATILSTSPPVREFLSRSPVHAAAAQDDLGILARLGSYFGTFGERDVAHEFTAPFRASAHTFLDSTRLMLHPENQRPFDVANQPGFYGFTPNQARGLLGMFPPIAVVSGGINSLIAQPLGIVSESFPIYGNPEHPIRDMIPFMNGINAAPMDRAQRRDYIAARVNFLSMFVGSVRGSVLMRQATRGGPPRFIYPVEGRLTGPREPEPVYAEFEDITPPNEGGYVDRRPLQLTGPQVPVASVPRAPGPGPAFPTINTAGFPVPEAPQTPPPPGHDPDMDTFRGEVAQSDAGHIQQMETLVQESELGRRSPNLMAEYLDSLSPNTMVFIDPQPILDIYANAGLTPGQGGGVFDEVPGFEEDITRAAQNGGDIEMSLGTYLAYVAGHPNADELRRAIRMREDGISVQESEDLSEYYSSYETIKARPGVNVANTMHLLGNVLYGSASNQAAVSIKELLQNSLDAVVPTLAHSEGKISIHTDAAARTITLTDSGHGMSPDTLAGPFLTVAESVKERAHSSGGFGIAKLQFLYGADRIVVDTLREGVYSHLETTGEDLKVAASTNNPDLVPDVTILRGNEIPQEILDLFPTGSGTRVSVAIPAKYKTTSGNEYDIAFPGRPVPSELVNSPLLYPVDVTYSHAPDVAEMDVYDKKTFEKHSVNGVYTTTVPIGKNFDPDKFTTLGTVLCEWGEIRVYMTKKEEEQYSQNAIILSNGLFQFTDSILIGQKRLPHKFYFDVRSFGSPHEEGYPFNLNRQQFNPNAKQDYDKITKYLKALFQRQTLINEARSFGTIQYMQRKGNNFVFTKTEDAKPPVPVTDTSMKPDHTFKIVIQDGELVDESQGGRVLDVDKLSENLIDPKNLKIPQDQIDAESLMIHDNVVVYVGGEEGSYYDGDTYGKPQELNTNWQAFVPHMRSLYGQRFDDLMGQIAGTFKSLRDHIADEIGYDSIREEAVGISFDIGYHGVSIRIPFSGMFVNPAVVRGDTPVDWALHMLGTMIHEMAHYRVRSHDADFAAEMGRIALFVERSNFVANDRQFTYEGAKQRFVTLIQKNEDIMTQMRKYAYGKHSNGSSLFKPRGERFADGDEQSAVDAGGGDAQLFASLDRRGSDGTETPGGGPEQGPESGGDSGGSEQEVRAQVAADIDRAVAEYQGKIAVEAKDLTPTEQHRAAIVEAAIRRATAKAMDNQFLGQLFKDAKAAGMSEKQFRAYSTKLPLALEKANIDLILRAIRQIKRERNPDWKEAQTRNIAEVEQELFKRPDIVAYFYLRYGEAPDGAPIEAMKLDRKNVESILGADLTKALPRAMFASSSAPKTGRTVEWNKRYGILAEDAAGLFGFGSGREMLESLVAIEQAMTAAQIKSGREYLKTLTKSIAANVTGEELGWDLTPENIEAQASAAVTQKLVTDLLTAEYKRLGQMAGFPITLDDVQLNARIGFESYSVRRALNLRYFENAVLRSGRKAEEALLQKNPDIRKAFLAKQNQLTAHYQLIEAHNFRRLFEREIKRLNSIGRSKTRSGMDQRFLDQVHAILLQMGVRVARDPAELRRGMLASDTISFIGLMEPDVVPYGTMNRFVPPTVPPGTPGAPYMSFTVEDFENTVDLVKNFMKLGRSVGQFTIDGKVFDFELLIEQMLKGGAGIPNKPNSRLAGGRKNLPEYFNSFPSGADAALKKVEEMADALDDDFTEGVFNRVLINEANRAANEKGDLRKTYMDPITNAFMEIPKSVVSKYGDFLEAPLLDPLDDAPVGPPRNLRILRGDVLSLALNLGTADNVRKLVEGYQTNYEAVKAFVDQHLTESEWKFVEKVWQTLKTLGAEYDKSERLLKGYGIKLVEGHDVETPFGTIKGEYYPIAYDYKLSSGLQDRLLHDPSDPISTLLAGPSGVYTPSGSTKSRTGYTGPILLNIQSVLVNHLDEVFTRMAYGQWVSDVRRFIFDKRVKAYVMSKMGLEYYNELLPWVEDQIRDPIMRSLEAHVFQKFFRQVRTNLQLAVMGASVSIGAQQILGTFAGIPYLGSRWVALGWGKMFSLLKQGGLTKFGMPDTSVLDDFVFSRSEEMRQRAGEVMRELREVLKDSAPIMGKGVTARRLYRASQRGSMHYIGVMDRYTVSMPIWLGAYYKGLRKYRMSESRAIAYADKAVRVTQGTGRNMGMAKIMRSSSEFWAMATFAYSYGSTMYQVSTGRVFRNVRRGFGNMGGGGGGSGGPPPVPPGMPPLPMPGEGRGPRPGKEFGQALAWAVLMGIVSPLMSAIFSGDGPGEDEDLMQWVMLRIFFNPFSQVPLVRDAGRAAQFQTERMMAHPGSRANARDLAADTGSSLATVRTLAIVAQALVDDLDAFTDRGPREGAQYIRENAILVSALTGIPGGGQVGKTGQYLYDLLSGEVYDQSPADIIHGLANGPPRRNP